MKNMIIALLAAAFALVVIFGVNYWGDCPGCIGAALFVTGALLGYVFRKMP